MAIEVRHRRLRKRSLVGLQRKLFHHTRFGGVPFFRRVWEICSVDRKLRNIGIVKRGHPAALLTYAYVLGGLIGSRCLRQLKDRWQGDGYLADAVGAGRRFGVHNWSRLLARFDFYRLLGAVVRQLQRWDSTAACPERGILILDDTPVEKSGRAMEGAHSLWDHAKGRFVWGYPLIHLFYQAKRICYPVGFRLQTKRRRGRPPKPGRKIELAMQLIKEAAEFGLMGRAVVFDPAYCAVKFLRYLDRQSFHWVSRLQSNRIVYLEEKRFTVKQLARKWSWFTYDPVRDLSYISKVGFLRGYDLPVQVVVIRSKGIRGYWVLVSSLMDVAWQEIFKLYDRRFEIETFHRDLKQYLGLADFRYRDLRRINNHIALVYVRYQLLALMRLAFPELGALSWGDIQRSVIRTVQELHVAQRTLRILLPPDNPLFRQLLLRLKLHAHPIAA